MLMRIILIKLTGYLTEKSQNKNFTVEFPGKTPLKLKKYPQKSDDFNPYLLQAQSALVLHVE